MHTTQNAPTGIPPRGPGKEGLPVQVHESTSVVTSVGMTGRRVVGVDYYPEHWPEARWSVDLDLMAAAGVRSVRVAEFAWCRIEPSRGRFTLEWLRRFVDAAAQREIGVIMCTPTATPPAWLCNELPEIMPVLADGRTMSFGGRRHYDPSNEAYIERCIDVVGAMAAHFREHPAVFAWQIDNELHGNTPAFNPSIRAAFHRWLRERYGSIDALNRAWGTIFWSQEYDRFEQIPIPEGNPALQNGDSAHHPSLRLLFRRFVSDVWTDFVEAQISILREANPRWTLTTNAYLFRWGDAIDYARLFANLDVFSFDNYADSLEEGAFYNDLAGSICNGRYWILEQKCASPHGQYRWPVDDPDMETLSRQAFAHGAELVSYFRFRQCPFGHEQNHGAILGHDGVPRDYYDVLRTVATAVAETPATTASASQPQEVAADATIYYSWEDSWIHQIARSEYLTYISEVLHPAITDWVEEGIAGPDPPQSDWDGDRAGRVRFLFPAHVDLWIAALPSVRAHRDRQATEGERTAVVRQSTGARLTADPVPAAAAAESRQTTAADDSNGADPAAPPLSSQPVGAPSQPAVPTPAGAAGPAPTDAEPRPAEPAAPPPQTPPVLVIPLAIAAPSALANAAFAAVESGWTVVCVGDLARKTEDNVYLGDNIGKAWQTLLGISVERTFAIAGEGGAVETAGGLVIRHRVDDVTPQRTTTVIDTFRDGPVPGAPAVTLRNFVGGGRAVFVAGLPDRQSWNRILKRVAGPTVPT